MNTVLTKKLMVAAVLTAGCQMSYASSGAGDRCNASNDATGWGIWCGVDTYLAKQTEDQPTAAGSGPSTMPDIAVETLNNKDSDRFGGKVKKPVDSVGSRPPVVPNPEQPQILPIKPVANDAGLQGYWVSSTYDYQKEKYLAKDKDEYKTISWTEVSEPVTALGAMSAQLTDGDPDQIAQSFYNPEGQLVETVSFSGSLPYTVNSTEFLNTNVNLSTDQNIRSTAYGQSSQTGDRITFSTNYIGSDGSRIIGISLSESSSSRGSYNSEIQGYLAGSDPSAILKDYWTGFVSIGNTSIDSYKEVGEGTGYVINSSSDGINYTSVYGKLTPLQEIQRLIAGNVRANYSGKSMVYRQDVAINVDFGKKTFKGNWTGGNNGAFDFGASGVLQGRNIVSTQITGGTGMVQGSFFGKDAKNLGGVYDVKNGTKVIRDVFATSKVTAGGAK